MEDLNPYSSIETDWNTFDLERHHGNYAEESSTASSANVVPVDVVADVEASPCKKTRVRTSPCKTITIVRDPASREGQTAKIGRLDADGKHHDVYQVYNASRGRLHLYC